jgi:hypothetical protein
LQTTSRCVIWILAGALALVLLGVFVQWIRAGLVKPAQKKFPLLILASDEVGLFKRMYDGQPAGIAKIGDVFLGVVASVGAHIVSVSDESPHPNRGWGDVVSPRISLRECKIEKSAEWAARRKEYVSFKTLGTTAMDGFLGSQFNHVLNRLIVDLAYDYLFDAGDRPSVVSQDDSYAVGLHRSRWGRFNSNLDPRPLDVFHKLYILRSGFSIGAGSLEGTVEKPCLQATNNGQQGDTDQVKDVSYPYVYRHGGKFGDRYGVLCIILSLRACIPLGGCGLHLAVDAIDGDAFGCDAFGCRRRRLVGWLMVSTALFLNIAACVSGGIGCLPWNWWDCLK